LPRQAHVIGDEQAHTRHLQGLAQRFELVGLDIDPSAVRSLKKLGVGGGDAVPAQGVEVGGELLGLVKAPLGHGLPAALPQHLDVDFPLTEHRQPLANGVVLHAGHRHNCVGAGLLGGLHVFHQVAAGAAADNGSGLELLAGSGGRGGHALTDSSLWRTRAATSQSCST
jgi:hypothetical protein